MKANSNGSIRSKPINSISGKFYDKSNFNQSKIEIYQDPDNKTEIKVYFDNETFWLSLNQIAELFGCDKSVISRNLKNIFVEGELEKNQVVAFFTSTAIDKKTYQVEYILTLMQLSRLIIALILNKVRGLESGQRRGLKIIS